MTVEPMTIRGGLPAEIEALMVRAAPAGLANEVQSLVEHAKTMTVRTVEEHRAVLETIAALRRKERQIEEHFEPTRSALDRAKRELLRARDSLLRPLAEARVVLGGKCDEFTVEARKRADEERRRREEAGRKRAEEVQLLDAIEAEAEGSPAEAEAILEKPVEAPVVIVQPEVAHVDGVAERTVTKADIVDFLAVVRHVAAHPEFLEVLAPVMPKFHALARAMGSSLNFPGVRVVFDTVRAVRQS